MLRQSDKSSKGVFIRAWITWILKNLELFPIREPGDMVGHSTMITEVPFISWRHHQPQGEGSEEIGEALGIPEMAQEAVGRQEGAGEQMQQDDIRSAVQDLSSKIQSIQQEQQTIIKKQSGLLQFMRNCFNKIGENFHIDFASCSFSSEEDV